MNLQYAGEERIPANPDDVWAFVTDAGNVARCFPDLLEFTVTDRTHVDAVVLVHVGPVRGKLRLKVELVPAPSDRRIEMRVAGAGFGSAIDTSAGADVTDAGDGSTLLKWSGRAVARGPVASVGGRVLDRQAKKLIEQAFGNVRGRMDLPA